jgi:WD40 repeat protein
MLAVTLAFATALFLRWDNMPCDLFRPFMTDTTLTLVADADDHPQGVIHAPQGVIWSVAFTPDGKTLASGGGVHGKPGELKLRDAATGAARATLRGHEYAVSSVAFSPDGKTLASGGGVHGRPGELKLWHSATGATSTLWGHFHAVRSVAFSPDGKTLASGGDDRTVRLWDAASGAARATLRGHTGEVKSVAFSPDGKTLASGSGEWTKSGELKLWDATTGAARATLQGHEDLIHSVAFSPDGKTLASGSWDETVWLWDVATGAARATLRGHKHGVWSVAFSPDGKTLASGSLDNTVRLWDAATGAARATLGGHMHSAHSVAFSPDGKTLASGGGEVGEPGEFKLWDPDAKDNPNGAIQKSVWESIRDGYPGVTDIRNYMSRIPDYNVSSERLTKDAMELAGLARRAKWSPEKTLKMLDAAIDMARRQGLMPVFGVEAAKDSAAFVAALDDVGRGADSGSVPVPRR